MDKQTTKEALLEKYNLTEDDFLEIVELFRLLYIWDTEKTSKEKLSNPIVVEKTKQVL